mgnify:CR=1 FL=1
MEESAVRPDDRHSVRPYASTMELVVRLADKGSRGVPNQAGGVAGCRSNAAIFLGALGSLLEYFLKSLWTSGQEQGTLPPQDIIDGAGSMLEIMTERCCLRPMTDADFPALCRYLQIPG